MILKEGRKMICIDDLKLLNKLNRIVITRHARERMRERMIEPDEEKWDSEFRERKVQ